MIKISEIKHNFIYYVNGKRVQPELFHKHFLFCVKSPLFYRICRVNNIMTLYHPETTTPIEV